MKTIEEILEKIADLEAYKLKLREEVSRLDARIDKLYVKVQEVCEHKAMNNMYAPQVDLDSPQEVEQKHTFFGKHCVDCGKIWLSDEETKR